MSTSIPEGFVLVSPRSRETATALLDAADKIKADRQADVRTVTNGYLVTEAVAEKYAKAFPDAEIQKADEAEDAEAEKPAKKSRASKTPAE